jgi:hypothetical protein
MLKDLDRVTQRPVEVGAGYVDLKRVFDNSEASGLTVSICRTRCCARAAKKHYYQLRQYSKVVLIFKGIQYLKESDNYIV